MTTTTNMKNNCEQELKKMERQGAEKDTTIADLRLDLFSCVLLESIYWPGIYPTLV
jgi:hypothetical protein